MRGAITRVGFGIWLGCVTAAAAQLPPDVMVDKYLLQARMLSEEKDHAGALEAMDRVVSLQKKHDLTLPEEFSFQYAQTALGASSVEAAIESANRYLTAAGREGKYYREALELLVKAERRLQEPAADRVGSTPVKPDLEPQPQAVLPALTQPQKTSEAQPVVDCKKWNTKKFFRKATVEDVTACINAGADLDAREGRLLFSNCAACTPLHRAVQYNENVEVVQALLKGGADPNAQDKWKDTPLHDAARYNENPAVIETLLKAGAGANLETRVGNGVTPLNLAARYNENPAVIETLLKAGANLETRDSNENTPLHWAAYRNDNPEVVKALIDAGADLTAWNEADNTPLKMARRRHKKVLRNAWARLPESQKAAARARRKSQSDGGGGWAALVAGVAGGAMASASGLDAATATELGATIAGSVLADEAVGSGGTGAASGGTSGNTGATAGGGPCQVPGYPNPPGGVSNLGFSWCPASVGLQVRSFALQAAGAECAIATGSSSTPEQIQARRREMRAACDRLAALGQGNCQCPAGLGQ